MARLYHDLCLAELLRKSPGFRASPSLFSLPADRGGPLARKPHHTFTTGLLKG